MLRKISNKTITRNIINCEFIMRERERGRGAGGGRRERENNCIL